MKLIKILPNKIQIRSNDYDFSEIHLNDLIEISDGDVNLITMVSALTNEDAEIQIEEYDYITEETGSMKNIECNIIGSVIDGIFVNSIDRYPTTDVTAKIISSNDFSDMLSPEKSNCFQIGKYVGYDTDAYVDGNKFFQRHSCIVGNTGSGKSETVAKIIEEASKATNCNIVIFDIHGEYDGLCSDTIRIGEEFPFPLWMLTFRDVVANLLKVDENSTVAMSALRKAYNDQCPNGNESKPIYFDFRKMFEYVKNLNEEVIDSGEVYKTGDKKGQPKTSKGEYNGKLNGIVNSMESLITNKRYSFLFNDAFQFQGDLCEVTRNLMKDGVKNINLSEIPHDIAILIIGAITKIIYNEQLNIKDWCIRPISLVCDEAHVYIPAGIQLSASQRRMVDIFDNIAKEGRKFGVTLLVASQRPSELNKTIMAQCANYIVMKLNNENDKTMMKGIIAEGSSGIIEQTSMFSPGDAMIIGDAVPAPLKIHVDLAKNRPNSKTIQFWNEWKKKI